MAGGVPRFLTERVRSVSRGAGRQSEELAVMEDQRAAVFTQCNRLDFPDQDGMVAGKHAVHQRTFKMRQARRQNGVSALVQAPVAHIVPGAAPGRKLPGDLALFVGQDVDGVATLANAVCI